MAKGFLCAPALSALCICLGISCAGSGQARNLVTEESTRRQVELFPQRGHSFPVSSVAYSPDGRFVVSGSADSSIKIWDLEQGREILTLPEHEAAVRSVAYSPDGTRIASGSVDATIKLWDAGAGEELATLTGHSDVVNSVAYSPGGELLASGSTDRTVKIWDTEIGQVLWTFSGHSRLVNEVCFSPDSRVLASASRDGTVKLWNTTTGILLRTLSARSSEALTVRFSPDGRLIASGFADSAIVVWDAASGREARTIAGHEGVARTVVFSPDSRYIASASTMDSTIRIWDAQTGRQLRSIGIAGVETLSYSPDGRHIVSGSLDNAIRLWDASTGAALLTLAGRSSWVRSVAYSPDGKSIALGSTDRTIHIWEAGTGRETLTLAGHTGTVRSVAYSPDSSRVVSGAADSSVRVWDAASGRELQTLWGHSSVVRAVSYDPSGRFIASGSSDASIKVWDALTGEELWTFAGHTGEVNALAFSPDGLSIVSGSSDRTVKIWDMTGGSPKTLRGHTAAVTAVAYSSYSGRIASGSMDGTVRLWNAESGQRLETLPGYSTHIKSGLAFSSNGVFLASAMDNNTISIYNAVSNEEMRLLRGHAGEIYSLAYNPDGSRIVSASLDGTTRIWDIATGRELVQSIGFNNGEWISIAPDGYYVASAWGDRYYNIRIGGNVYGLELYRSFFYNPLLVHSRLQGRTVRNNRTLRNINTFGVPPRVVIAGPADGERLGSPAVELSASALDGQFPLQSLRIYVNDRLVGLDLMAGLAGTGIRPAATGIGVPGRRQEISLQLPLEIDIGTNRIDVVASNGYIEGIASVTVETPRYLSLNQNPKPALPNLKVLAIGAGRYEDPRIDHLGFSVFDARGIIDAFKAQEGKLYGTVSSLLIATGELQMPNKDAITRALSGFFKDAGSRDTLLLFLAGHGVNDEDGNYFFLPSDIRLNADGSIPYQDAVPLGAIAAALDVPGRKLLFIDTSHTPGIPAAHIRPVDSGRLAMDLKPLRPLVFSSGRGDELSGESETYRAGFFGYALKEGLGGAADANKNRIITMRELDAYVTGRVADLSGGLQHPSTNSLGDYVDFDLLAFDIPPAGGE
jgi:WD40 repeat protein